MSGMNAAAGTRLTGLDHIRQSIADILSTPLESRVMRREYGSLLPELIGRPLSDILVLQVYAATVMAIARWEPRVRIERIHRFISTIQPGQAMIDIELIRLDTGTPERVRTDVAIGIGGLA